MVHDVHAEECGAIVETVWSKLQGKTRPLLVWLNKPVADSRNHLLLGGHPPVAQGAQGLHMLSCRWKDGGRGDRGQSHVQFFVQSQSHCPEPLDGPAAADELTCDCYAEHLHWATQNWFMIAGGTVAYHVQQVGVSYGAVHNSGYVGIDFSAIMFACCFCTFDVDFVLFQLARNHMHRIVANSKLLVEDKLTCCYRFYGTKYLCYC